jgi:hypothetical protein
VVVAMTPLTGVALSLRRLSAFLVRQRRTRGAG